MRARFWLTASLIVLVPVLASAQSTRTVNVGVVIDGPGSLNVGVQDLTKQAILELTEGEFDVRFPSEKTLTADWTRTGIRAAFERLLADPQVDLVLAMGVIASFEAAAYGPLPKPVVAPFVLNYGLDQLPMRDGVSGVPNLSYLVLPRTFRRDVETFISILDFIELQKVAVLFSEKIVTALPFIQHHIELVLADLGIDHQSVLVGEDAAGVVEQLDEDVDGAFVMPLIHLPGEDIETLAQRLIERRLPSFALLGRSDVERGLLASLNPDMFPRITRRIGLHVQNILLGDAPESLRVAFAAGERLTINVVTANAMDLPLRWATVTEADVVGDDGVGRGPELGLLMVVQGALESNRELAAAEQQLLADAQDVSLARSQLFPQADLDATGLLIDEDRAEASFGSQAERTLTGSASLTQLLYSEKAWANVGIQNELQASRDADLVGLRMDVVQEAVTAYLEVLRAESLEQIQQDNLKLTRSNLELAQVRELVGQSGPAEALRFESQLASNISDAIEANARRNVAEIELNRILHRPLEEPFRTAEKGLEDVLAELRAHQVSYYFSSKRAFAAFRDFLVEEGLGMSPELASLDRAIAAQQRSLRSARRAFWSPTLALQGDVSHLFDESGAGVSPPPGFGSGADDTNWSVALALSFPLFEGGAKWARRRQATAQIGQLDRQREFLSERIAQRTRSALHLVGATFAAIEQAQRARAAADRSLELVVDAYAQGTVSILDLLDAQTRALVADEQEAASVFDFFIDLMEVYRSMGAIETMLDAEARELLLERADAYFLNRNLSPRP